MQIITSEFIVYLEDFLGPVKHIKLIRFNLLTDIDFVNNVDGMNRTQYEYHCTNRRFI